MSKSMNVVFIGGYYDKDLEKELIGYAKAPLENSANIFQYKMINGFEKIGAKLNILSAPLVGAWPQRSKIVNMHEPERGDGRINYVPFNNIWGYRNISRRRSLIKKIKETVDFEAENIVVVYSPHTPFIEAACYIKKRSPRSKICLVVPDLPQFMMLVKKPLYYKILKYFDTKHIYSLCNKVDNYMVLTDAMLDVMPGGREKPSIVAEGIADGIVEVGDVGFNPVKTILYSGKLEENFGIMWLLDAFKKLERDDVRLVICGKGEKTEEVAEAADGKRIVYKGQVSAEESSRLMQEADVLINPRVMRLEYTKYSFPSKNMEYLIKGKAVIAYMFEGTPEIYRNFFYVPEDDSKAALIQTINNALDSTEEERTVRKQAAAEYINGNLRADIICSRITEMCKSGMDGAM